MGTEKYGYSWRAWKRRRADGVPGPWSNSVSKAEYEKLYGEILAQLDPRQTWNDLHKLASGAEPVLLCWEQAAHICSGKAWCHRRMVAAWFKKTLGFDVPEFAGNMTKG